MHRYFRNASYKMPDLRIKADMILITYGMANINLYTAEIHIHKYGLVLAVLINNWNVKKDSKSFQVPPALGLAQPHEAK